MDEFTTELGLLLPDPGGHWSRGRTPSQQQHLDSMAVVLSGSTLGIESTVDLLLIDLAAMTRADVANTASFLLARIEQVGGPGLLQSQIEFVELYPVAFQDVLKDALELGSNMGGFDVLFAPQHLKSMQRLAIRYCPDEEPTNFEDGTAFGHFLQAIARVADITQSLSRWPTRSPLEGVGFSARELYVQMLRGFAVNSISPFQAKGGRAYRMWFDSDIPWPSTIKTLDSYCRENFGLSVASAVAALAAPAFVRLNSDQSGYATWGFRPDEYLGHLHESGDTEKLFERFTADSLGRAESEATYWDYSALASKPFVMAGGRIVPSSLSNAFDRATAGLFWLIHEDLLGTAELEIFTRFAGDVFESYCVRLVTASVDRSTSLATGEIEYERDGLSVLSSDVLVCDDNEQPARVFLETTFARPRVSVFREANVDDFRSYEERVLGKIAQVKRVAAAHRAGQFEIPGDRLPTDAPYFPVVVVDDPFLWTPEFKSLVDSSDEGGPDGTISHPIVISVSDLERLAYLAEDGTSISSAIRSYMLETNRDVIFEQFLHGSYELGTPKFLADGFDKLTELIASQFGNDPGSAVSAP